VAFFYLLMQQFFFAFAFEVTRKPKIYVEQNLPELGQHGNHASGLLIQTLHLFVQEENPEFTL